MRTSVVAAALLALGAQACIKPYDDFPRSKTDGATEVLSAFADGDSRLGDGLRPAKDGGEVFDQRVGDGSRGESPSVCVDQCGPQKVRGCLEGFRYICDDYDSDGCLEWVNKSSCPKGLECSKGRCKCLLDCTNKKCGSDGCGGACGSCADGEFCEQGTCIPCKDTCGEKTCGDDKCGGNCGVCDDLQYCDLDGQCVSCLAFCALVECGTDPCGGSCGDCPSGTSCQDGVCSPACFPLCDGKECGNDYCGGSCGECVAPTPYCVEAMGSICLADCVPNCMGQECGGDGCGGSCGQCPADWYCNSGMCIPTCIPQCLVPPAYLSYKQCGWDECPGKNVCGVCPPGFYCAPGYMCVEDNCSCDGKQCGQPSPGCPPCGNLGGDCPEGESCNPLTFQCGLCQPSCFNANASFKICGSDGCGGSCGTCPMDTECDETVDPVVCSECVPKCMHPPDYIWPMECGPNQCPTGCMDAGIKPCSKSSDCDAGQQCNVLTGMCVECGSCGFCPPGYVCDVETVIDPEFYVCGGCIPNCAGKECGGNGCGGYCGMCPSGWDCVDGICEKPCNPTAGCFGKECGPNGCPQGCLEPKTEPCAEGICPANMECNSETQTCEVLQCGQFGECPAGSVCDPDQNLCTTCGNCGNCSDDSYCALGNICMTKPETDICDENNWECGPDGSGGSCGTCPDGEQCIGGKCQESACVPLCVGKLCGDNGCGGECGSCAPAEFCDEPRYCENCLVDCWFVDCGPSACGNTCLCPDYEICSDGQCMEGTCQPQCDDKECGWDGCQGNCGVCNAGHACEQWQCVEIP